MGHQNLDRVFLEADVILENFPQLQCLYLDNFMTDITISPLCLNTYPCVCIVLKKLLNVSMQKGLINAQYLAPESTAKFLTLESS